MVPALETLIYTRATHICIQLFAFCFATVMSDKSIKISSCACYLVNSSVLFVLFFAFFVCFFYQGWELLLTIHISGTTKIQLELYQTWSLSVGFVIFLATH